MLVVNRLRYVILHATARDFVTQSNYVVESQSCAEQDCLLAGTARYAPHDTRQHLRL